MPSKMIEITAKDGGKFNGYLAIPDAGHGPGLIIGQEIFGVNKTMRETADLFAKEGYVVLIPDMFWRLEPGVELRYTEEDFGKAFGYFERFNLETAVDDIDSAMGELIKQSECDSEKIGYMGFCLGGKLAFLTAAHLDPAVAISFYGVGIPEMLDEAKNISCPLMFHCPELDEWMRPEGVESLRKTFEGNTDVEIYGYLGADHGFYNHDREVFHKSSVSLAHSRTIAILRKTLGPKYDLEALWEQHLGFEFEDRNVDATMTTMVDEPYVNHIPTLTGGVGAEELHRFYLNHFVHANPEDTKIVPVSRTVGSDRIVDELLLCFTHTEEIDWLLPGIKPTGKYVEVPTIAVVNFRGDKLYHEHIYWDQASVLAQIGLLDTEGLPVGGQDVARKMVDPSSVPSNQLMERWSESEPK